MLYNVIPEYPFASNFIEINNNRLHYIDEGSGPVIVMVHGNPTWSYYYRRLISYLSSTHRVIVLDNIGCGLSDKPQDYNYTLSNHIHNLSFLLNSLDIKKSSFVVHDWGGAIGMGYAGRNPTSIEKIVILNTAAFRSTDIPFRIQICRWPIIGKLLVKGLNGFAWPATFMAVSKPLEKDVKKAYLAPYSSWDNRVAIYGFVKDIPLKKSHPSYSTLLEVENGLEEIRNEKIPLQILWGGKDFCFTSAFYDVWCRRFPDAEKHYFSHAGHYVLEDAHEEILPLIGRFLLN